MTDEMRWRRSLVFVGGKGGDFLQCFIYVDVFRWVPTYLPSVIRGLHGNDGMSGSMPLVSR